MRAVAEAYAQAPGERSSANGERKGPVGLAIGVTHMVALSRFVRSFSMPRVSFSRYAERQCISRVQAAVTRLDATSPACDRNIMARQSKHVAIIL